MLITKTIKIGNLFKLCCADNDLFYEEQELPFIVAVETPNGFKKINKLVKKNDVETVKVRIGTTEVVGADLHKVKIENEWKNLKDIDDVVYIGKHDLYDVMLDEPHEYMTVNGIIHHNSSSAKALCKDMNADFLYKNMSKDTGIDVLRDEISKFARTKSFSGNTKIIILDEVCQSSLNFQKGLKAFIEQYTNSCRFILTCNTLSKVIPELQSRCQTLHYDWHGEAVEGEMKPKIKTRIITILKKFKVEYDESAIDGVIQKYYPDIRRMYNVLQQYSDMNGKIDKDILHFKEIGSELVEYILNKKIKDARTHIIENNIDGNDFFRFVYTDVVPKLDKTVKAQSIIMINEYQFKDAFVIDKEINIMAFLIEFIGEFVK